MQIHPYMYEDCESMFNTNRNQNPEILGNLEILAWISPEQRGRMVTYFTVLCC